MQRDRILRKLKHCAQQGLRFLNEGQAVQFRDAKNDDDDDDNDEKLQTFFLIPDYGSVVVILSTYNRTGKNKGKGPYPRRERIQDVQKYSSNHA